MSTLTIGEDVYRIRNLWYGTSSTAASTATKTVSCSNYTLSSGDVINVKFTVTNTAATSALKLNVNSTGDKSVKYRGGDLPDPSILSAGRTYSFVYDGTNFVLLGDVGSVDLDQGVVNAGKFLVVNSNGIVEPVSMTAWQGGDY